MTRQLSRAIHAGISFIQIMKQVKKNSLVYPRSYFVEDLLRLKERGDIRLTVFLCETSEENKWLIRRFDEAETNAVILARKTNSIKPEKTFVLRFCLLNNGLHPDSTNLEADFRSDAHLYMTTATTNGTNSVSGYIRFDEETLNFDELFLVGAGMHRLLTVNTRQLIPNQNDYEAFLDSAYARERWQMTRKALGDEAWKRMCLLKVLIVGAGRSGETAFLELARFGVGNIVICDGDMLERRNLGEMKLVTDKDIGRNKAEITLEKVSDFRHSTSAQDCFTFRSVNSFNFNSYEAQLAAQECDVIVCCVDSDGGRAYASYIAARYHKVLLDIGSGILRDEQNPTLKKVGYDVRLVMPGDGCLMCWGGFDEAQSEVEIFNRHERDHQRKEGHIEREGSLSNLNASAVNEGISLLQELCRGEVKNSTWIQFDKNNGRTSISQTKKAHYDNCHCKKAVSEKNIFTDA